VRQRIKRAIDGLSTEPRPHHSRVLDLSKVEDAEPIPQGIEVRRLRLDHWRVIYAIDESWRTVIVLAIRRRPPYDYEDLDRLIAGLASG
jgi:mRNA interferase RelE/StbE